MFKIEYKYKFGKKVTEVFETEKDFLNKLKELEKPCYTILNLENVIVLLEELQDEASDMDAWNELQEIIKEAK